MVSMMYFEHMNH